MTARLVLISRSALCLTISLAPALAAPARAPSPTYFPSAPARAPAALGDEYVEPRLGLKISFPKGWSSIPMNVDERWKVAKWLSDKSYFWTEKGDGWTHEHKPTMEVIAFVADAMKEKVKVEKKKDKDGNIEWRAFIENPFKDYKDFLTRRYTGGGWFVSDEKEDKLGDVPVTKYEIKVEKLSNDGPKRIFAWVYHLPDVDVAVQFEVLENAVDKIKNDVNRCLKSFKKTPRSGEALFESVNTGDKYLWADEDKMTPEERKTRRQGMELRSQQKATKTLPDGWVSKKMGRFLVLNHADEKYAQRVVEQAEAVWDWLDETFGFLGKGEYVRSPILRICKNEDEQRAFFQGGDYFGVNELEITTCQDYGGSTSWEMEWVNRRVKDAWFRDRDRELALAMPGWLQRGLDNFVGQIHVKNGKADFGTDYWNRDEVRDRLREGKLTPVRELMMLGQQDFYSDWNKSRESAALFGFFVAGPASRTKQTKDLLPEYMRNLRGIVSDIRKEEDGHVIEEKSTKPQTEAEEDEMFKHRQQGYKQKEQRLLEETFKRTFLTWKDDDWKKLQEAYEKSF